MFLMEQSGEQSEIKCHKVVPLPLGSNNNNRGLSLVNMVAGKACPTSSDSTDQLKGVPRLPVHYPTKSVVVSSIMTSSCYSTMSTLNFQVTSLLLFYERSKLQFRSGNSHKTPHLTTAHPH